MKGIARQRHASARLPGMQRGPVRRDAGAPALAQRTQHLRVGFARLRGSAQRGDRVAAPVQHAAHQPGQGLRRAHLQQHVPLPRRMLAKRVLHGIGKPHRRAQLAAPVIDRGGFVRRDRRATDAGVERALWRLQHDACKRLPEQRQRAVHQGGMKGVADAQPGAGNLLARQAGGAGVDGLGAAAEHGLRGRVAACDLHPGWQSRGQRIGVQPYHQHGARRLRGHRCAARHDQRQRVLQREYAGPAGGHIFADAVANHYRRLQTPRGPQFGQRVFHREQRGLGVAGVGERAVGGFFIARWRQDQRMQIAPEMPAGDGAAMLERGTEHRLMQGQRACHAGMLRALPRKQEHQRRRRA